MTWYRMSGSSKGELHGASVLVTVDGEITSGDTVTLTKTGYSQTKTLSDVKTALFTDILDSGTYTATYKTFSKTVEVSAQDVLDKTTKSVTISQSVTLTLTIEGAKEDNIKIYDSANTQVGSCVFASGQTTGTVDLEIPPTGGTYKFESTVAKDTETGTSNYSKNVSLTNTSSSVKVMPDNCLYWYGNECTDVTGGWTFNGYTYGGLSDESFQKQNNSIYTTYSSGASIRGIGTNNAITRQGKNSLCLSTNFTDFKNATGYESALQRYLCSSKTKYANNITKLIREGGHIGYHKDVGDISDVGIDTEFFVVFCNYNISSYYTIGDINAVWLE